MNHSQDQPLPFHPTLRDVAADAGVSHMTVSRVLRGVEVVSAKTAERVKASISRLGYRPDPALSSLAHRRKRLARVRSVGEDIVFLDCDGSPFTAKVAAAAEREAAWHGHQLERLPLPPTGEERRALSRRLAHRRIEGLIIGPAPETLDLTDWDWTRFAAVAVGILPHRPALHAVSMEYFQAFLTAEAELRKVGERPGLCLRAAIDARSGRRWTAACRSCDGLPPPLIFQDLDDLAKRLPAWMRRHRVTYVLTTETMHEPLLREAGLRLGYLGSYNAPEGVDHLSLNTEDLGRETARLLHHALIRRDFGPPETPLIVGVRARWISGTAAKKSD